MANSVIAKAIDSIPFFAFKPNQEFYQKTGINRKRWGALFRGEVSPTLEEITRLSMVLRIPIERFIKVPPIAPVNTKTGLFSN